MKVKDILGSKGSRVVTIGLRATLHEALCTLIENKVGALPVRDDAGEILGIITERDLMREVYRNSPLSMKGVEEVMTRGIVYAAPDDDVERIMNEMTEGRFRHMPVMKEGKLVGIVSIGDVVKALLHLTKRQVRDLMDYVASPTPE